MTGKRFTILAIAIVVLGGVAIAWRALSPGTAPPDRAAGSADWNIEKAQGELASLRERLNGGERTDQLATDYRQLVERYPRFAAARAEYAMVLYDSRRWEDAYEQVTKSLELDPQKASVQLLAGTIASNLGLHDKALKFYGEAVALEPANGSYRVHLAQAQIQLNRLDDARMTLLESLRLDSENHVGYGLLADVYARQNKMTLAMTQIQHAIDHTPAQIRPVQAAYVQRKAAYLRRLNKPEESLQVLTTELLSDDRLRPDVIADIATSWAMMGKPAKAAEAYEEAFNLVPADPALALGAAEWRLKAGDADKARRHIETLRHLEPRHAKLQDLEARLATPQSKAATQSKAE